MVAEWVMWRADDGAKAEDPALKENAVTQLWKVLHCCFPGLNNPLPFYGKGFEMLDVFQEHYHLLSAENWQDLDLSLACVSWAQTDSSRRQCSCQSRAAQIRLKQSKRKQGKAAKLMPLPELQGFISLGFAVFFCDFSSVIPRPVQHILCFDSSLHLEIIIS